MLYGNMIFIKKTGGDGSKFPVTERSIKIGRSEDCLIRIHNPQIASEHCELIINDDGQAKLRNLSKLTTLNGKCISQGDVTLHHGDIFKLGERLARWEYLPTSKYYQQYLSPNGRLIAVVVPQQRSVNRGNSPGTSNSGPSVFKGTPQERKQRHSKQLVLENGSTKKESRTNNSNKTPKSLINNLKFLTMLYGLQGTKALLSPKVKQRKSASGVSSSKPLAKGTFRKSTMASWKVNLVTPSSNRKLSEKKSPVNKNISSIKQIENVVKSAKKSIIKTPSLKTVSETPVKEVSKTKETKPSNQFSPEMFSPTPSKKATPKSKSARSEKKLNFDKKKRSVSPKSPKRLSLKQKVKTPKSTVKKMQERLSKSMSLASSVVDSVNASSNMFDSFVLLNDVSNDSIKKVTSPKKAATPAKSKRASRRKSVNLNKSIAKGKTSTKASKCPNLMKFPPPQKTPKSEKKFSPVSRTPKSKAKSSPAPKTPKSKAAEYSPAIKPLKSEEKTLPRLRTSYLSLKSRKSDVESLEMSPRASAKKTLKGGKSPSRERPASAKGVRRELSPSLFSAERAAKKLKTSLPRKPDKNKKAALLVLGKANRKHLQNAKMFLKQRIVKKAIKQSKTLPVRKGGKASKQVKKGPKKRAAKLKKKSSEKGTPKAEKATVKALRMAEALMANTSVLNSSAKQLFDSKALENKISNLSRSSSTSSQISSSVMVLPDKGSSPKRKIQKLSASRVSFSPVKQTSTILGSPFEKSLSVANYSFGSNRRCSKRLSSKNDVSRPDFMELSPTALGLIPKNVGVFKTPKEGKRRSSSLTTPKNTLMAGIIKSASTSKIRNRKSVRFSSKDTSISPTPDTLNFTKETDFDFDSVRTPNITMEHFVSPLTEKNTASVKNETNELKKGLTGDTAKSKGSPKLRSKSAECAQKILQSPQMPISVSAMEVEQNVKTPKSVKVSDSPQTIKTQISTELSDSKKSPKKVSSVVKNEQQSRVSPRGKKSPKQESFEELFRTLGDSKISKTNSSGEQVVENSLHSPKVQKTPKNDSVNISGVKMMVSTPKSRKSPNLKSKLSDADDAKKSISTPKPQKSPKNDSSKVESLKKSASISKFSPGSGSKAIKRPNNDSSGGAAKKKMRTLKFQKNPLNDLSNVRGVKKLLRTPKLQKSPKNDLSDVSGVKKLMKTPKLQKSPKNDLTNISGVKKLMRTPKPQKSPKNDMSDVSGVKKLLRTPKLQKSPKNDLSNVSDVKKLMRTPKSQPKSPKNDLSVIAGIKKLLQTPKPQKSPKNDLSDLRGVKELLGSPKNQKSPKNELTDLRGVKKLLKTPKAPKSPKNDLSDVRGVKRLLTTPKPQKSPKNDLTNVAGVRKLMKTPQVQKSPKNDLTDVEGVKRLLKTPKALASLKSKQTKRLMKTQQARKSPKNELSDLTGVFQLFESPQVHGSSSNDFVNVSGGRQLFESSEKPKAGNKSHGTPERPQSLKSNVNEVKQLLVAKSPAVSSIKKVKKSKVVSDFRAIRGRRTIYSTPKGPKNDLTDVAGVGELFARNTASKELTTDLTGVAELFEIHGELKVDKKQDVFFAARKKSAPKIPDDVSVRSRKSRRLVDDSSTTKKDVEIVQPKGRPRKGSASKTKAEKKSLSNNNLESKVMTEEKSSKRKPVKKVNTTSGKKAVKSPVAKTTRAKRKKSENDVSLAVVGPRKRKAPPATLEPSPPKLRKRQVVAKEQVPGKEVSKKTSSSRQKQSTKAVPGTKASVTSIARRKVIATASKTKTLKVQSKTSKTPTQKTGAKTIAKVQKERSQTGSQAKKSKELTSLEISPRKTRGGTREKKSPVQRKASGLKTAKSTIVKKELSPPAKRTTRRKRN